MITSLGSVPIFVSDQNRSLEFFRDKLNFEVVFDRQYGPEFRWVAVALRKGETELVLLHPVRALAGDQLEELNSRIGIWTGIVFFTDDINSTYNSLRNLGVEFDTQPKMQGWGGMEAIFSDPDGNRFHLVQRQNSK